MVVLVPGAFVQGRSVVHLTPRQQVSLKSSVTKLYPIELYVGGSISNYGIKALVEQNGGRSNGVLTFFYDSFDVQQNWMKFF